MSALDGFSKSVLASTEAKYRAFNKLAQSSGWQVKKHWNDAKRYYAVFLLQA